MSLPELPANRLLATLALLQVFVLGCGGSNPRVEVSGTVTFDGEPIAPGEIKFDPIDTSLPEDGGTIKDGKFRFPASPGKKIVRIRASRPLPDDQQDSPEMGLLYEDYLPAKFNDDSTLEVEVSVDRPKPFSFDLKSK